MVGDRAVWGKLGKSPSLNSGAADVAEAIVVVVTAVVVGRIVVAG
jgi:hypothetical protein